MKKNNKIQIRKHKRFYILILTFLTIFLLLFGLVPFILSVYEKKLEYPEIKEKINDNVRNSIVFVGFEVNDNDASIENHGNVSVISGTSIDPTGAGAIVFKNENNKYFALTANHVIESKDIVNMYAVRYDKNWITGNYEEFPKITVEYSDKSKDLAIISFDSLESWGVLNVSKDNIQINSKIFTISSPNISNTDDYYKNRNLVSYGKVLSTNITRKAKYEGGYYKLNKTFLSTLYVGNGSSGSGIINDKMEIVGIVHAGGKSIFGSQVSCFGIPTDVIKSFIDDWNQNRNY